MNPYTCTDHDISEHQRVAKAAAGRKAALAVRKAAREALQSTVEVDEWVLLSACTNLAAHNVPEALVILRRLIDGPVGKALEDFLELHGVG
jgi:hypothetical protein